MEAEKGNKRRVPLWVKILLGISLALNLAIVGLVAGTAMRIGSAPGGPGAANYAIPYVLAMPRKDRRDVWDTLRSESRAGRLPSRKDRKGRYVEMIKILSEETWDPEKAKAILAQQSADSNAVHSAAQTAWLELVSGYTQAERHSYAEHLTEVVKRRRKRH